MTEWFVRNARDARRLEDDLGAYCSFEEEGERFPELGVNLSVLQPGRPMAIYHRESHQEDFLVLSGDLLIAEGRGAPAGGIRRLRQAEERRRFATSSCRTETD
jgi:hypothetical protein